MMTAGMQRADDVDAGVLDRAQRGDPTAFATLVGRYDPRLRALVWTLLADRQAMDDVLQEVYVKAFRGLPDFRGAARIGTWLHRIAYHACVDELRRRQHRPALFDPLVDHDEPAARLPSHEATVVQRLSVDDALAVLPPDQAAAVVLVDGAGYDYDSCAEILGVAPGTVASRLSRARARLRSAL